MPWYKQSYDTEREKDKKERRTESDKKIEIERERREKEREEQKLKERGIAREKKKEMSSIGPPPQHPPTPTHPHPLATHQNPRAPCWHGRPRSPPLLPCHPKSHFLLFSLSLFPCRSEQLLCDLYFERVTCRCRSIVLLMFARRSTVAAASGWAVRRAKYRSTGQSGILTERSRGRSPPPRTGNSVIGERGVTVLIPPPNACSSSNLSCPFVHFPFLSSHGAQTITTRVRWAAADALRGTADAALPSPGQPGAVRRW